jgi:acyl transferase domain-containing protein
LHRTSVQRGNPAIDFEEWRLQVPTETKDWPLEGLQRASVNSFGYGGTNAHVFVDDAYHYLQQCRRSGGHVRNDSDFVSPACEMTFGAAPRSRLFLLSANDERGLAYMRKTLADHLQTQSDFDEEGLLDSLAYTLCERRSRFSFSATIVAKGQARSGRATTKSCPSYKQSRNTATNRFHIHWSRCPMVGYGQGAAPLPNIQEQPTEMRYDYEKSGR